jgi:outer membrane protein assembly factor BamD
VRPFISLTGLELFEPMKLKFLLFVLLGLNLVSCSEYQKLLKSTDYELKWTKANEFYDQKKYSKAITLLEELQPIHKGTDRAEQTLFMLGNAYNNKKDYISASHYFETYYKTYPKGLFTEDCRFLSGKAAYLNSPESRLTQEETVKAMDQLNIFLDYYPESDKKEEVTKMMTELQDKLVYKQLLNSRLYFNLGNYMGNNYQSCIITANNALLDYPVSKYREDLSFLILHSRYMMASQSLEALKLERFRTTIDEYYSFVNEFPQSKYLKEAGNILKESQKYIKE